jgi:hypothetical protein
VRINLLSIKLAGLNISFQPMPLLKRRGQLGIILVATFVSAWLLKAQASGQQRGLRLQLQCEQVRGTAILY